MTRGANRHSLPYRRDGSVRLTKSRRSDASWPHRAPHSSPARCCPGMAGWEGGHDKLGRIDKESQSMSDELWERFRKTAADSLGKPVEEITMTASFADDLDADSLDLVQLVMDLEEEFDITVDEDELEGITKVGQAYELVLSKL